MPRTRTKGGLYESSQRNTDYNPDGSVSGSTLYLSTSKAEGEVGVITDVVTPQFNKLRSHGGIAMNPLDLFKDERHTTLDTLVFGPHPSWGKRVVTGTLACQWSMPPVYPEWFARRVAESKASTLTKAHAKVADASVQGLVTVAEFHKTVKMLASPFAAADALIGRMHKRAEVLYKRRGNPGWKRYAQVNARQAKDFVDSMTQAYLELRFGFRPLLREIGQIFDAYAERNYGDAVHKPIRQVARASETVEWSEQSAIYSRTDIPGVTKVTLIRDSERKVKVASGVLYEIRDHSLEESVKRNWGIRLSDIPAAAWELVPLSFVVDRFLAVGTWIQSITPQPGVQVLGQWTTCVDRAASQHELYQASVYVGTVPATTYLAEGGTYKEQSLHVTRDPNPILSPLPSVNYRDLDALQRLDHLALIVQKLNGFKLGKLKG